MDNNNQAIQETLIAIESQTKATISRINAKKSLLKVKREMYKSVFDNSDEWREADKAYREARIRRLEVKNKLLEQPQTKQLDDEIHEMATDIKGEQLALSDWLYNYEKQTGSTMIDVEDGATYLVQRSYKVKKESKAARWVRLHAKNSILAAQEAGVESGAAGSIS